MADHPGAKQSTTGDRTSALVAGGLALLAAVGVGTIFSDTIAAAWAPATPSPSAPAPSAPARQADNAALSTSPDGGVAAP